MYVCMYIYTHICINTYVHMYIFIYICKVPFLTTFLILVCMTCTHIGSSNKGYPARV